MKKSSLGLYIHFSIVNKLITKKSYLFDGKDDYDTSGYLGAVIVPNEGIVIILQPSAIKIVYSVVIG